MMSSDKSKELNQELDTEVEIVRLLEVNRELICRVDTLTSDNLNLEKQIDCIKADHQNTLKELQDSVTSDIETLEGLLEEKRNEVERLRKELREESSSASEACLEQIQEIEELKRELEQKQVETSKLKEKIKKLELCIENADKEKLHMINKVERLGSELARQRKTSDCLRKDITFLSGECENLKENMDKLEVSCEQWSEMYKEELDKTKGLTEELSLSQHQQLETLFHYHSVAVTDTPKDDPISLVHEIASDLAQEEMYARPPSVVSPANHCSSTTTYYDDVFIDNNKCSRCIELETRTERLMIEVDQMNAQIIRVAKQKYELQLQLEAWQNDMEYMIEKQLHNPVLKKTSN